MTTYEINIICDGCGNNCYTAEPTRVIDKEKARQEAKSEGWSRNNGKDLCPDCVAKRKATR